MGMQSRLLPLRLAWLAAGTPPLALEPRSQAGVHGSQSSHPFAGVGLAVGLCPTQGPHLQRTCGSNCLALELAL